MGLTLDVSDDAAIEYVLAISAGKVESGDEVVNWLADRLVELEP
jgi:hypothetical protein